MNLNASTTPVPVLAPGNGKTRTGRLWTYLRDVLYRDTPDRKGERCREHLSSFSGHLHADGYAGFAELYEGAEGKPANVNEVACWVHVRASSATCTRPTALPSHARRSIGSGRCSTSIAAKSAEKWRAVRQSLAKEKLDNLAAWLDQQLTLLSGKSALAGAIRYARSRWGADTLPTMGGWRFSNNPAENAIRPARWAARTGSSRAAMPAHAPVPRSS